MDTSKELSKGFDWAILISVLLVVLGHVIGDMITDNYYFDGFTPVKKDKTKAIQVI